MFDTNVFNLILDSNFDIDSIPHADYFCTKWQEGEIRNTKNEERKEKLLYTFSVIQSERQTSEAPPRSTPWGSPWGSPWDQAGKFYTPIKDRLEQCKPKDRGNTGDAVNIETCIYEKISFVSADKAARTVAAEFGVESISFDEFMKRDSNPTSASAKAER